MPNLPASQEGIDSFGIGAAFHPDREIADDYKFLSEAFFPKYHDLLDDGEEAKAQELLQEVQALFTDLDNYSPAEFELLLGMVEDDLDEAEEFAAGEWDLDDVVDKVTGHEQKTEPSETAEEPTKYLSAKEYALLMGREKTRRLLTMASRMIASRTVVGKLQLSPREDRQ